MKFRQNVLSQSTAYWLPFGMVLLALAVSGCTTALRNQQLERVAKDWALVIRATRSFRSIP
jgi:hypothetical protein